MYEDIIDINEEQIHSKLYSRISFVAGLLNLTTVVISFSAIWLLHFEMLYDWGRNTLVLVCCFSVIGLLASLISFRIKERSSFYKWSGVIINAGVVVGLAALFYLYG